MHIQAAHSNLGASVHSQILHSFLLSLLEQISLQLTTPSVDIDASAGAGGGTDTIRL